MIHSNHQKMDTIGGGHLHLESELEKNGRLMLFHNWSRETKIKSLFISNCSEKTFDIGKFISHQTLVYI